MAEPKTAAEVAKMLEGLTSGDTLLVQAIKTANDSKVQLEFAEKMTQLEGNSGALLGLLNASDDRFSSGARRAWMTAEINDIGAKLGINCGDDAAWEHNSQLGRDVLPLGIMNPAISNHRLRVRIAETVIPTDYQKENIEKSAKRKGAEGDFITFEGKYIFSNTEVVPMAGDNDPTHTVLEADSVSVPAGTKGIVDETAEAGL